MPFRARLSIPACLFALLASGAARADDAPVSSAQVRADAHGYYDAEMTSAFLFVGYGAVTAGAGGVVLTQSGDFSRGLGASSLILGGLTVLGGIGYGVAVKIRGTYYTGLADTDLARFQREEAEHIHGTNQRFWLYLGSEIAETLAGVGIAAYGFAAKNDLSKGIGVGTAIQGIGLFVIDVPGAGRAAKYQDQLRGFKPGFSIGGGGRPWAATISKTF